METCIDTATKKLQNDLSLITPGETAKKELCTHSLNQYQEMSQCYHLLPQYSLIPDRPGRNRHAPHQPQLSEPG